MIKIYQLKLRSNNFAILNDEVLSMARTMRCGPIPLLGTTTENLKIPIIVSERYEVAETEIDETSKKLVGPTGNASVLIPAGTKVWGSCRRDTQIIEKFRLQLVRSDKVDGQGKFEIQW